MRRIPVLCGLAFAIAALVAAPPAQAQIGGLLKKAKQKVEAAAGAQPDTGAARSAPAPAPASGPRFNERVLEMTPAVLDRLVSALEAEAASRQARERELAALPSDAEWRADKDKYDACLQGLMLTPEGQQLVIAHAQRMTQVRNEQDGAKAQAELDRAVEPKCGRNPGQESPSSRRAALARSAGKTAPAGGFTAVQLAMLKERVVPFCSATQHGPGAAGGASVPGSGRGVFYVYAAAEVEALQPRCAKLLPLLPA